MLPKTHMLLGLVFSGIVWFLFPAIPGWGILLVFLSSFLIDFDHYVVFVLKQKKMSLNESLKWHDKEDVVQRKEKAAGIRQKGHFHLFHTIEFHGIVWLLGYFLWSGFLYVTIGMIFHSVCDLVYLIQKDYLYRREYLFVNWLRRKLTRN